VASDTFTALLGLLKQGIGNNNNTWGSLLNSGVMDEVDLAIAGRNPQTVTGGTLDLSASPPPAGPSGAIHAILDLSGTLASNQIVQVPNLSKIWLVNNGCTLAGHTLTFKTPSGSASLAIPSGWAKVWCDGNNNCFVGRSASLGDPQYFAPDGTLAAPGISFFNEQGTGIRRKGTQDVCVTVNGADVLEITGAGASTPSVINVLSPNAFQVQGVAYIPSGAEIDYSGLVEPTGWYFPVGQTKNRTTDAALFAAIAPNSIGGVAITGNTHTNTTLDNLTVDLRGLGLVGALIEGTGIPTGTTIASINSATALTLSQAATGTATGIAIRALPYGQGDAATTFNLPDRRGAAPFIRDDLGGTAKGNLTKSTTQGIDGTKLNATGGEQAHTLTFGEIPAHTHPVTITDPGHFHTVPSGGGASSSLAANNALQVTGTVNTSTATTGITATVPATGGGASPPGGGAHNVVPPATICNRLIKR
jgi:microcystin-dependent protein